MGFSAVGPFALYGWCGASNGCPCEIVDPFVSRKTHEQTNSHSAHLELPPEGFRLATVMRMCHGLNLHSRRSFLGSLVPGENVRHPHLFMCGEIPEGAFGEMVSTARSHCNVDCGFGGERDMLYLLCLLFSAALTHLPLCGISRFCRGGLLTVSLWF